MLLPYGEIITAEQSSASDYDIFHKMVRAMEQTPSQNVNYLFKD